MPLWQSAVDTSLHTRPLALKLATSSAPIREMPAAGMPEMSRLTPKPMLAETMSLCQVSMPSTSVVGSASA